jgi:NRPS condensation-like uncharacterized protein
MSNLRKLASFEKIFWLLDQTSQVHFVMAAEISGVFSVQQLTNALAGLQERHPFFSAYIESGDYKDPYFKHVDNAPIPLRVVGGNSLIDWSEEMAKELDVPFDWSAAPLMRAVLIQDNNSAVIILTSHHAIGDAISMSFAFRDLLSILAGKGLDKLPIPSSIDKLAGIIEDESVQPGSERHENTPAFTRRSEARPQVNLLKLSAGVTSCILERARQEGTTVHGAICAAIIRAAREASIEWKTKQIRVVSPFSSRKTLGADENYGLYIGSRKIVFEADNSAGFWDLARYSKEALAGITTLESVIAGAKGMRQMAFSDIDVHLFSEKLQQVVAREMMITNIGRQSYETAFGTLMLESLWGPLAFSGSKGEQVIGISTVNGRMCLAHLSRIPLKSLLLRTSRELHAACR